MVAVSVGLFLITAVCGILNPRDTSQPEGAVVAAALRLAAGEPLYLDVRHGPSYVTAMYGPLLYAALGTAVKLTGAGVDGAYRLGRLAALLSAVVAAGLVGALARRYGASRQSAWIAAGIFLSSPLLLPVAYSTRSDVPALALSLTGLYLFDRWADSPRRYLAALPLLAAAYTKQTAVAATVAITLGLLLAKRPLPALTFLSVVAIPAGVIFLALDQATGGLARLHLLEVPGASPLSLVSRPLGGLATFLLLAALPLILAAGALVRLFQGDTRLRIPVLYAATALLISLAASTKLGSDTYYFMEPMAGVAILAGAVLPRLLEEGGAPRWGTQSALLAGTFAVLTAASVGMTARMGEYRPVSNANAIQLAAAAPGPVLVEDENVALKCGKTVTIMDPFAFAYMSRRGRWDAEPLNRRIRGREFSLLLLRYPLEHPSHYQGEIYWAESTLAAMGENYRPAEMVDGFYVYRPRAEGVAGARPGASS
jgi:hypothetical protein